MSRREGRSVSLGRSRDRTARDHSRGPPPPCEDETSTRHNVSNFMLTLQRVQTAEDENRQLRKENHLLRQRARSSRLSSASFSSGGGGGTTLTKPHRSSSPHGMTPDPVRTTPDTDSEDKMIEENVKRNSLIFVGDAPIFPQSPEHVALEAQYKKLQTDFNTIKDFLKHLFHHALTMSTSSSSSSTPSPTSTTYRDPKTHPSFYNKESNNKVKDANTFNPTYSKQLEHNLEDIHGEISQIRNSQDQQQLRMEQVQLALDNVLSQSSVRNDVTMRIVRQQDKMKDLQRHVAYLESHLMEANKSIRSAEEKLGRMSQVQRNFDSFISSSGKNLKGTAKSDLIRFSDQLSQLDTKPSSSVNKMARVNKLVSHVASTSHKGQTLIDSKPPADVIDSISKLERLIGSDWHRFGRMLGLGVDCLDDIGKFTNFDLTTRVEKVMATWARTQKGPNGELLKQALIKMDRNIFLLCETPVSKDVCPVPPDVLAFFVAHAVDISHISRSMAWHGILSQDAILFILAGTEEYKRASRLIHTTVFMGLPALQMLCHVLETSNQTHVAIKLKGCLPGNSESDENTWELHSAATLPHKPLTTYNNPVINSSSKKQQNCKVDSNIHDSSSSSSSSHRPKSREKNRTKRSRSLFTRKNKLRDNEPNEQIVVDHQDKDVENIQDSYYPVTVV